MATESSKTFLSLMKALRKQAQAGRLSPDLMQGHSLDEQAAKSYVEAALQGGASPKEAYQTLKDWDLILTGERAQAAADDVMGTPAEDKPRVSSSTQKGSSGEEFDTTETDVVVPPDEVEVKATRTAPATAVDADRGDAIVKAGELALDGVNRARAKVGLKPLDTVMTGDAVSNREALEAGIEELHTAIRQRSGSSSAADRVMGTTKKAMKTLLSAVEDPPKDAYAHKVRSLASQYVGAYDFSALKPEAPATPNTGAGTAGAPTININTGKAAKAAEEMFDFGAGFKGTQAQARMLEALKHLGIEAPAKGFTKAEVMRLGPEILNRLTQIPGGAEAIQAHMASLSPEDLADPTKSMAALMEGVQTKIPGLEQEAQKAAEASAKKEAVAAAKKRLGSPEYRKMAKGQFVPDKASVLELLTSGEGLDLGKTKRMAQSQYLREGNTSGYEKLTPELQKTLDAELSQQVRKNKAKVSVPKELSAGFEKTALENELLASGAGPLKSLIARSGGLKGMGKAAGATALLALLFKGMSLYDEHKEENLADLQMQGRSTESMLEDLKAQRALQRQALAEAGAAGPQALQLLRSKLPPMTPSEVYIGPDPSGT